MTTSSRKVIDQYIEEYGITTIGGGYSFVEVASHLTESHAVERLTRLIEIAQGKPKQLTRDELIEQIKKLPRGSSMSFTPEVIAILNYEEPPMVVLGGTTNVLVPPRVAEEVYAIINEHFGEATEATVFSNIFGGYRDFVYVAEGVKPLRVSINPDNTVTHEVLG